MTSSDWKPPWRRLFRCRPWRSSSCEPAEAISPEVEMNEAAEETARQAIIAQILAQNAFYTYLSKVLHQQIREGFQQLSLAALEELRTSLEEQAQEMQHFPQTIVVPANPNDQP